MQLNGILKSFMYSKVCYNHKKVKLFSVLPRACMFSDFNTVTVNYITSIHIRPRVARRLHSYAIYLMNALKN